MLGCRRLQFWKRRLWTMQHFGHKQKQILSAKLCAFYRVLKVSVKKYLQIPHNHCFVFSESFQGVQASRIWRGYIMQGRSIEWSGEDKGLHHLAEIKPNHSPALPCTPIGKYVNFKCLRNVFVGYWIAMASCICGVGSTTPSVTPPVTKFFCYQHK